MTSVSIKTVIVVTGATPAVTGATLSLIGTNSITIGATSDLIAKFSFPIETTFVLIGIAVFEWPLFPSEQPLFFFHWKDLYSHRNCLCSHWNKLCFHTEPYIYISKLWCQPVLSNKRSSKESCWLKSVWKLKNTIEALSLTKDECHFQWLGFYLTRWNRRNLDISTFDIDCRVGQISF